MSEETQTGSDLVVVENIVPAKLFAEGVDEILAKIREQASVESADATTPKGRKAIASMAYKVARSKTLLDDMGKKLTEDKRKEIASVDAERRKIRAYLDGLKDEVRKPLDEWEEAEAERVAGVRSRLDALDAGRADMHCPVEQIERVIAEIEGTPIDDTWQEFGTEAAKRKDAALSTLRTNLDAARNREAEQAELARLRADQEERERKAREEAQAEAAKEAEARAAKEAEAKAAAEKAANEAAERERKRADDEKAKQEAEAAKRAADQKHRGKVNREAAKAIEATGVTEDQAKAIVIAIFSGDVPHISIKY